MKRIIITCFVVLTGMLSAQVSTTGLISNWSFSGNANDIVGGNNGTVFNATLTPDRFGNPNCAYKFNGSSSYIIMANAGITGTVSRSVSFWAKSTNTTLTAAFACGSAGAFAIQFNYSCSGVGFDDGGGAYIMSNPNVSDGSWHHYSAVYNSTVSTQMSGIQFYMDGLLLPGLGCTTGSTLSTINTSTTFPINIGKVADNNIRYFDGDLDDFFLYNRALSSSEVLALYNDAQCTATPPSPATVSGNTLVCPGSVVIYSIVPVAGASSYSWTLPGGWSGTSLTNTISITIGPLSGQIAVACKNCCGYSQPTTLDISVSCTGIKEELKNSVQFIILPNPNRGSFTVKRSGNENSKLEIYNNIGQIVYSRRLEKAEEKIEVKLSNGVYFVLIHNDNNIASSQRLIITDQ